MREIKPEQTTRAKAYELWMKAPYLTISFQYHHTQWEFLKVE